MLTLHSSSVARRLKIQFLFLYANYTLQNLEEDIGLVRGKGKEKSTTRLYKEIGRRGWNSQRWGLKSAKTRVENTRGTKLIGRRHSGRLRSGSVACLLTGGIIEWDVAYNERAGHCMRLTGTRGQYGASAGTSNTSTHLWEDKQLEGRYMRIQRVSAYIFGIEDLIRSRYGQMRGKDENGPDYTDLHTIIREASAGDNRV